MDISCQVHATAVPTDKEPVDPHYPLDKRFGGPQSRTAWKTEDHDPSVKMRVSSLQAVTSLTGLSWLNIKYDFPNVSAYFAIFISHWCWCSFIAEIHVLLCSIQHNKRTCQKSEGISCVSLDLTFRRRIKSRLPFAGIIMRLPYSTRFQDKG